MNNQISKKSYIFLLVVIIISFASVWYSCKITIKEINLLTSNIAGIISEEGDHSDEDIDEDIDEDVDKPDDSKEQEEFVCLMPAIKILSAGYYYGSQGDQLGIGPLPPVVDIQTNYWIFWEIIQNNKDLNNFEISAELPDNVVWTNNKTALSGSLKYGEVSKKVIWTVDQVDKNKGNYKIGFEIGLIPADQDINSILNLLTNIQYKAIDKSCQQEIKGKLNNITTDLIYDNLAKNKGIIVPSE